MDNSSAQTLAVTVSGVVLLGVVLFLVSFITKWSKQNRDPRGLVQEVIRELEKRVAPAKVIYETLSWAKLQSVHKVLWDEGFKSDLGLFLDMPYIETRADGYLSLNVPQKTGTITMHCIPYSLRQGSHVRCFASWKFGQTPSHVWLGSDLITGSSGFQLESREFNSKYKLTGDDPKVHTATFDPTVIDQFEKYGKQRANLKLANNCLRAEFDITFSAEGIASIPPLLQRVVKNYQSAVAGMPLNSKRE